MQRLPETGRRDVGRQLPPTGPRRSEAFGQVDVSASRRAGGTQSDKGRMPRHRPPPTRLPPGLADHPDYEIKRELGRGGMGVVYLAHNTLMGRDEVLKVMGRHIMERPGVLERFLREIRAVAKLRHPNIVTAYHATRLGQSIVFAMEYVEGLDLSKLVKAKGPLPVAHACNFVYQAALGLQHAHEEGLVHRDIKPGNLMLSRKGDKATVKVLDFGLAKATREEKVDGGLTSDRASPRHPRLHRPRTDPRRHECRHPGRHLQPRRHALLPPDRPPAVPGEFALRHLPGPHLPRRRSAEPGPPRGAGRAGRLVAKMMAKDPARRFQTPGEVAQALTPFFKKANAAFKSAKLDVSQASQSGAGPPGGKAVLTPSQPATDAGGPAVRAKNAAEPTVPEARWESLIEFGETEPMVDSTRGIAHARRPPWMWPSVAAGVLLFCFVAASLVVVLRVRTPEGDLVFDGLPEQAVVTIDRRVYTVEWPGGKGPAKVTVPVGDHRVKVELDGVELYGEEVQIAAGTKKPIIFRLKPADALRTERNNAAKVESNPVESKKDAETSPWPGALTQSGQRFPQGSRFLAMSRDCRRVAVASATGVVRVFEAPDVGRVVEVKGQPRNGQGNPVYVWGTEFSPDGKYLASACNDPPDWIWDASTGEEVRQLNGADYHSAACAYSSDGKRLAVAGRRKGVLVWDAMTGEKLVTLGPSSLETCCVAFSPDGRRLASGGGAMPGDDEKWGAGRRVDGLGPGDRDRLCPRRARVSGQLRRVQPRRPAARQCQHR